MEALRLMTETPTQNYDEIEKLLSCPICLEVFSKPVVILPCQHNLCRQCAHDMFQNRGTAVGSGGRFKCPSCRYDVVLDRHGVFGLQRNLLVENIIDMYQSEGRKSNFKKTEKFVTCDDHEDEKVNIYCTTCQKPTCSLCKVFGQHQECDVAPMEKIYKEQKKEISDAINFLSNGNERLQGIISQTEELERMTEENAKRVEENLNSAFDKLYETLDEKKHILTMKLQADLQERKQVLETLLKNYKLQLDSGNRLMTSSLTLIDERNIPQFLKLSREMIEKVVLAVSASDQREAPFQIHKMNEFHVNFHFQKEMLEKLDFTPLAGDESSDDCFDDEMFKNDFESHPCDVIAEERSDGDMESSVDDETQRPSEAGSVALCELDEVANEVESQSLNVESKTNMNESRENETKKGRWFDMYVRQLPSPISMSESSAPMESSVHMKVIIPATTSDEEEDLKKEKSAVVKSDASEENEDLDLEIERLLNPRRRRWNSKFTVHSSPEISPRSSPMHFRSQHNMLYGDSPSPNASPLLHRQRYNLRSISPPPYLSKSSSTSKSRPARASSPVDFLDVSVDSIPFQQNKSKKQKLKSKPRSGLNSGGTSTVTLKDQDKNQAKNVSSSSGSEASRKPRVYCTHKRRTWSHLLDKK